MRGRGVPLGWQVGSAEGERVESVRYRKERRGRGNRRRRLGQKLGDRACPRDPWRLTERPVDVTAHVCPEAPPYHAGAGVATSPGARYNARRMSGRADREKRKPRVSVIMGTFNRAGLIGRAIESVLAQDYSDWELLVIGHCTPDNTAEVVARFGDPRIRFYNMPYRIPDRGSATKNYGIRNYARGEYIAYLDDDDRYRRGFLSTMVGYLEAHPEAQIVYCRSMYRDRRTGRRVWGNPFQRWLHDYSRDKLQKYNFLNVNCVVHRKRLLDEVGYWKPEFYFNDYELWLRISRKYDFHYVNRVLVETFVEEPPFVVRMFTKGWRILRHGRRTPLK